VKDILNFTLKKINDKKRYKIGRRLVPQKQHELHIWIYYMSKFRPMWGNPGGFWIPDPTAWIPDPTPWIPDSTSWIPDSEAVVDSGFQFIILCIVKPINTLSVPSESVYILSKKFW
jgi:hypothetical protein